MKTRFVVWTGLVLVVALQFIDRPVAQDAGVRALYDRAESLNRRTQNLIFNVAETPQWNVTETRPAAAIAQTTQAPGSLVTLSHLFTYRRSVKGGNEFIVVDANAKTKTPAFDHARLAASLSTAASAKYTAVTLPFNTFTFLNNRQAIEFTIGAAGGGRQGGGRQGGGAPAAPRWRCTLTEYTCTRAAASPADQAGAQGAGQGRAGGQGAGRGAGAGANATENVRASLDGKWEALIQNYNVFVRPAGSNTGGFLLSTDGSEGNAYTFNSLRWSSDSTKIAIMRRRPGYERLVHFVETSPTDQLQPKHSTMFYRKPGDVVDFDQPVVFDVATKKQMLGDIALFPNPYNNTQLAWRSDSRAVTFEYNQRGHQLYRVVEIDATSGKTRTVVEETSKTFVEYSGKKFRYDVNDGKEIIWASERDGWNHLYLYDGVTGQVKNQITKGQWVVRGVDPVDVDVKARTITFRASGMDAGKDPYLIQYCRINFDGTGLTRLTTEDGNHSITWSPDRQFYYDTWSRVDAPPQSALKRASDQSVVMPIETANITELLATGWRAPEVFTSKARDGQTDIWGVIIRPTNFDPAKKYPVIENIYAGPQGSFAPKTFSTQAGMQALAEFGFIVVQVDGLGTSNRSKAFHDVAWQNLGDAGFPDRIIWHKAIAAKYSYYDITRVGIYGTSAGGQNSTGGVLFHPEFYKVAVSNSGCHDNRMDKIWWNEQWMGWPIGPHYAASSNVDHAKNLKGRLQLLVPEMDSNVDPASTMQVVNALVRASKDFELVVIPGANHGGGSPITQRKRNDFFVKHLLGLDPPNWNAVEANSAAGNGDDAFAPEPDYFALERAPFFPDDVR